MILTFDPSLYLSEVKRIYRVCLKFYKIFIKQINVNYLSLI